MFSNQVRLARGRGDGWIVTLQEIVEDLRRAAEAPVVEGVVTPGR